MEIYSNDGVLKSSYPEAIKKNEKPAGKRFGAVLQETIERSSCVGAGPQSPSIMNNISEIRFNLFSPVEKTRIIDRVENFLNILDEYHQKLGNPQVTLKDIYPLISEMAAEEEGLIPVLNSLPDRDELKEILNQTLITSSLEIIKFNRGDYLSP
ncbi:MAG: hypothetical protein JRJ11_13955 [Deltaproteobacteria bacterium]|nr:hypothetical protein [Deltaproteobacteria bacterium]MBW1910621.1 hypothetical protein [Deltaproteobacteria bacterium]MBW2034607.1 hypothetical protein [Deltaproteobacteria bacterium]MBW2115404.1 hypothetical protein [Deltaproteobacteria bacterium]MBW2358926.1 hypothetical protein [Deltaproteobacteria bacterium]